MPIVQEKQQIIKPYIYTMDVYISSPDKDSQYLRMEFHFSREVKEELLKLALTITPSKMPKLISLWLTIRIYGKIEIKKYSRRRHILIIGTSKMLFTTSFLGINFLILSESCYYENEMLAGVKN